MKIILSRKGFDSANGGIASPIFDDNTMISFPIPSTPQKDSDTYHELYFQNKSYYELLKDLGYKKDIYCHIDPDLSIERRKKRIDGWKPIFGQINSSASYLLNNVNVEVGDIFLFFGNFRKVTLKNGKYTYVNRTSDFYSDHDLQVIWGYLQVGEIVTDHEAQKKFFWHPHSYEIRQERKTNVMFVAKDFLSFNNKLPGAGVLRYSKNKVLTLENANKATWVKRSFYDTDSIYGKRTNHSKFDNGIYYKGIWQELGLKECKEVEEWAKEIIETEK